MRDLLAGKPVPFRSTALLNAASAIVADGRLVSNGALADRFREAYTIAQQAVDSGKAAALLDEWIAVAQSHRG